MRKKEGYKGSHDGPSSSSSGSGPLRYSNNRSICRFYAVNGRCKFGDQCRFIHGSKNPVSSIGDSKLKQEVSKNSESSFVTFNMFLKRGLQSCSEPQLRIFIHAFNESILNNDIRPKIINTIGTEDGSAIFIHLLNSSKKIIVDGNTNENGISFSRILIPFLRVSTHTQILDSLQKTFTNPFFQSIISSINWDSLADALKIVVERNSPIDLTVQDNTKDLWIPKTLFDSLVPIVKLSLYMLNCFSILSVEKVKKIIEHLNKGYDVMMKDKELINDYEFNIFKEKYAELQSKRTKYQVKKIKAFAEKYIDQSVVLPEDMPGDMRTGGPRHDNDFVDISQIRVIPTADEIFCKIPPFLPQNRAGHVAHIAEDGVISHRDLHFRLLRHDLIWELQKAVTHFISIGGIKGIKEMKLNTRNAKIDLKGLNVDLYRSVKIEKLNVDKFQGITYQVSFKNLSFLNTKNFAYRKNFWERSKRLQNGTLACLIYLNDNPAEDNERPKILFGTVSSRDETKLSDKKPKISLKMFDEVSADIMTSAALGIKVLSASEVVMLQAGPSLFAYHPILKALKNVSIPLSKYLLAASDSCIKTSSATAAENIPAPRFLSKESGYYDLSFLLSQDKLAISKNNQVAELSAVSATRKITFPEAALAELTTLDRSQILALKAALTQEIALVQGPPGTGKTYVGIQIIRCLLKSNPKPGPILCVCFTNHALDQFLKGIIDCGIKDVIRVGGRSKSDELKDYSLRSKMYNATSSYQVHLRGKSRAEVLRLTDKIKEIKEQVNKLSDLHLHEWRYLRNLVQAFYPDFEYQLWSLYWTPPEAAWKKWLCGYPSEFFCQDDCDDKNDTGDYVQDNNVFRFLENIDENNNLVNKADEYYNQDNLNEMNMTVADLEMMEVSNRSIEDLFNEPEIWRFSQEERKKFSSYFAKYIIESKKEELKSLSENLENHLKIIKNVEDEIALNVLKVSSIVGMTTSYVAMHQNLLSAWKPKTVIVEEAAEVLEAHILTSLSAGTEHLILIGDHEQLRPKLEVYDLQVDSGKGYNLDVSLFERLILHETLPYVTLQTQRRMRPSFSRLIRETIYPELRDHPTMFEYPEKVIGMLNNLYFYDHNHPEDGADEGKSKSNNFEAMFAVKLCCYLILQGCYKSGEIAIITPYVGQLLKIRNFMAECHVNSQLHEKDEELIEKMGGLEELIENGSDIEQNKNKLPALNVRPLKEVVRLATIDNFQGEEAKIVILSLTRNNKHGKIGFLGIKNRINVLLSRAKEGMYILGNAKSLRSASKSDMWKKVLDIIAAEELVGNSIKVQCQRHPDKITEIVHWTDFDKYVGDGGCQDACSEQLSCGHMCRRRCHSDDPDHLMAMCMEKITVFLKCGHVINDLYCHKATNKNNLVCKEKVQVTSDYCPHGHKHTIPCSDANKFKDDPSSCTTLIKIKMPECNHEIEVQCGKSQSFLDDATSCKAICGKVNPECGHVCQGSCGSCKTNSLEGRGAHVKCTIKCKTNLICGHICNTVCHKGDCPPCQSKCEITCGHKPQGCKKKCSNPCFPCAEPCMWECHHKGRCILPCLAPCDRLPCDKRCDKELSCGCRCPCLCGEKCPPESFCLKHASENVKEQMVDFLEFKNFSDLTEGDVDKDPLIVLSCGHVFTTSSLDEIMKIEDFYCKDLNKEWLSPLPQPSKFHSQKSCSLCRTPIMNVMRYGRCINKAVVDKSERFFVSNFEKKYNELSTKLNSLKSKLSSNMLFRNSSDDQNFKQENAKLLKEFSDLADLAKTPPRFFLYAKTKAALLQLEYEHKLTEKEISRRLKNIGVFKPDLTRECRAKIGETSCLLLALQNDIKTIDNAFSDGYMKNPVNHKGVVKKNFYHFNHIYIKATHLTQYCLEYYESTQSITRAIYTRILNINLCIQMFSIAANLSFKYENLKNELEVYKKDFYEKGKENGRIALSIANNYNQREKIEKALNVLKKAKEDNKVSHLDILLAVIKAEKYDDTFGRGHIYTCPNGHIYIIGNCGQADDVSNCVECGARIGGLNHDLDQGNRRADEISEQIRNRIFYNQGSDDFCLLFLDQS